VPESRVHVEGHGRMSREAGKDAASLAANRRVEIVIEGARFEANAPLELVKAGGEPQKHRDVGVCLRGPARGTRPCANSVKTVERGASSIDIETLSPGIRWLTPEPTRCRDRVDQDRHPARAEADGELRSTARREQLNFDGVSFNDANTVALSRWRGVDLVDGDNELSAKISTRMARWCGRRSARCTYGGSPVRAELVKEASKLVADGRTRPVIALRMFDKYGKPARSGTIANFSVDSPYRSWWEVEQLNDNQILSTGRASRRSKCVRTVSR
jgi:hypothetical protein